ncbi:conserved hypothetical protein [Vibrio chagasii]|nr:conserved hypothetical protein [Vibrio chagasii]CAH6953997.1 conserved hypothetical protein [Vibrio chagasii]
MYIMNKNGRYFTVEGDLNADMLVDCTVYIKKEEMYQAAAIEQGITYGDVEGTDYFCRYDAIIGSWLEFDTRGARVKNESLDSMQIEEYLSSAS